MTQPLVPRILRPRRAAPADAVRPTRAEVNLEALRHNVRVVRRHAGAAHVWAVLKADAYGHGAPAVARTLERDRRVDGFCVALLEEGIELREAGIMAPILVMGGHYGTAHEEVIARGLIPVVHDLGQIAAFARLVRAGIASGPIDVHLKVDTGMARLGVTMQVLPALAARLSEFPEVRVRGLMTHLACAEDVDPRATIEQDQRFEEATTLLAGFGASPLVRHVANSAAILRGGVLYDAVRPGISLFGVAPRVDDEPVVRDLKPVMCVRTEIVAVRALEAGAPVGYGATWQSVGASRVATIPMGYADGLSRHLGNRGHVLVRGKRAPIVGAVSMDMAMIDVTAVDGAGVGDDVVVLGAQEGPLGSEIITADEIAAHAGTIPWEVLTSISRRVPRFYRDP
ncbi:MAG TPA: alanine racemase [Polyangiaceae bacterium]|jgi:alanine racemase|nr:alanine racemase [Polyangiaceae bacterium]